MTMTIKIWDVLQGLAVWIRTPNGKDIVIDAGVHSNGFSPIYNLNKKHNVARIDYAIITHPHKDHIDEIENLVYLNPEVLRIPKHLNEEDILWDQIRDKDKKLFEAFFDLKKRYTSNVQPNNDPSKPENYGGIKIKTFCSENCSRTNLNNHSIVTLLEYAGSKILIPGDNEEESWDELFRRKDFVESIKGTNILVASHHGRKSGHHLGLFDYIKPSLIIISDGPAKPTNAVSDYSLNVHEEGWLIHKPDNTSEKRKILTTRKDGMIKIDCYSNSGTNYCIVTKSK